MCAIIGIFNLNVSLSAQQAYQDVQPDFSRLCEHTCNKTLGNSTRVPPHELRPQHEQVRTGHVIARPRLTSDPFGAALEAYALSSSSISHAIGATSSDDTIGLPDDFCPHVCAELSDFLQRSILSTDELPSPSCASRCASLASALCTPSASRALLASSLP